MNQEMKEEFTRHEVQYTQDEIDFITCDRDVMRAQMRKLDLKHRAKHGRSIFFKNQEETATQIIEILKNRKIINTMVLAKTQSGKTGIMCTTIKKCMEDINIFIPIENIYIITGLSSLDWKYQTKERLPEALKQNVFHQRELSKRFVNEIKDKKNILIIIDEIQVAARENQTLFKMIKNAGLLDKTQLFEKDIKILEFTATPDGTIYDLMEWKDSSAKILAPPGEGYVSAYDLLKAGRVRQYKDLYGYSKIEEKVSEETYQNIREIKTLIEDTYYRPKYHIIRTPTSSKQDRVIENLKKVFGQLNYDYTRCDGENNIAQQNESEINDINHTLSVEPKKHTFIFIKEMFRCAKTLVKTHLGILYDRYRFTLPDDSVIIQGLIGRDTGYDNNGTSIVFSNIDTIERYEKLWSSGFENQTIEWYSKTTKQRDGKTTSSDTYKTARFYSSDESSFSESSQTETDVEVRVFTTEEEATAFGRNVLGVSFRITNRKRAATTLQQNGQNPTVEYLMNRKWGLEGGKPRKVVTRDNKWCVYWKKTE